MNEKEEIRKNLLKWLKIFLVNDCDKTYCEWLYAVKVYEMLLKEEED